MRGDILPTDKHRLEKDEVQDGARMNWLTDWRNVKGKADIVECYQR